VTDFKPAGRAPMRRLPARAAKRANGRARTAPFVLRPPPWRRANRLRVPIEIPAPSRRAPLSTGLLLGASLRPLATISSPPYMDASRFGK